MKLRFNPKRKQSGLALWIAAILFVLFLVFIGTLAYVMWKAINRILPKAPPAGAITSLTEAQASALDAETVTFATSNLTAQLQAANPGQTVTVTPVVIMSYPTNVTAFIPFGPLDMPVTIDRSTNLLNWDRVDSVAPGNVYVDTNGLPQAFYRRLDLLGRPVPNDTNYAPGFYYTPRP